MNIRTICRKTRLKKSGAFSLIEVVIALAIFSFVLVSVLGLLNLGVSNNKVSSNQIQAANLASLLLAARRAAPNSSSGNFSSATFPIPPLNITAKTANTSPIQVAINGSIATSGSTLPASDIYNLNYVLTPGVTSNVTVVYLLLWWPSTAASPTVNTPGSYYEITTQISHP